MSGASSPTRLYLIVTPVTVLGKGQCGKFDLPGPRFRSGAARAGKDRIDRREGVGAEGDLERAERRADELIHGAGADDRTRDPLLCQQPGECHGGGMLTEIGAQRLPAFELRS